MPAGARAPSASGAGGTVLLLLALACTGTTRPTDEKGALGADCALKGAAACLTGKCLPVDTGTAYCTQGCQGDGDCPGDYLCQVAAAFGKVCVKRAGAVCETDAQCPAGHKCDAAAKRCYIPVVRGLCGTCTSNLQCPENGGCQVVRATGEQFCTTPCDPETCPLGYTCTEVGRDRKQCIPDRQTCNAGKPLCAPCRGDAECGGVRDLCVRNVISGERFCGRDCAGGAGCPNGFSCVDLSGTANGPYQCVPNAQTCEGYCDATDPAAAETQCGLGHECEVSDNQCIGATDGRLCAPCADDDSCADPGRCVVNRESGETFCGTDCSENAANCPGTNCHKQDDKCPAGFSCVGIGEAGAWPYQCVPTRGTCLTGVGRVGDDCPGGAGDCLAGVCLEFGSAHICSASCGDDADCGDGRFRCCKLIPASGDQPAQFDCSQSPSGSGVCAPVGGGFGDDCAPGQPPCHSGLCLDIGTARLCTISCDDAHLCPTGFRCEEGQVAGGGAEDKVNICFPDGGGELGSDCTFGPAACQSRLCIKKVSGNLCTAACTNESECPADWACVGTETVDNQSVQVCVPPGTRR